VGSLGGAARPHRTWRLRLDPLLPALRLLALGLLVVALARPQRGEATAESSGSGIDIVLAFDSSSSMTLPFSRTSTRLQAAKEVISRFVKSRTDDRLGLVVFQGRSLTLSPLTTDYSAIDADIQSVDRVQLTPGTAIGVAIGQSVNLLRSSRASSRIVILLTDGENNVFEVQPLAAARIAEKLGVRVYTIGVVTPSGVIPGPNRGEVDEQSLQAIADVTGGTYNRAEDPAALRQIYERIDQLEKSQFEGRTFMRFDDIAPYFLAAAAAAIALELLLRQSLLRRVAA
jgi:Ca-activated chloride channel family protein